jgi:hypothetical protein
MLFAAMTNKEAQEQIDSARFLETLGYILGAVGILVVIASIPMAIYRDRKKKARKKALQREDKPRLSE